MRERCTVKLYRYLKCLTDECESKQHSQQNGGQNGQKYDKVSRDERQRHQKVRREAHDNEQKRDRKLRAKTHTAHSCVNAKTHTAHSCVNNADVSFTGKEV
jgi:hypothetical protein